MMRSTKKKKKKKQFKVSVAERKFLSVESCLCDEAVKLKMNKKLR